MLGKRGARIKAIGEAARTELADLRGRVALLTGGRVKIGYQAGLDRIISVWDKASKIAADYGVRVFTVGFGTLDGAGNVALGAATLSTGSAGPSDFSGVISGSGGLTKNGTGALTLGGAGTNPVHTYSGTTTITAGILQVYNMGTNGVPSGNLTITGGVLQDYFGNGGTFSRALGSAAGQVQITGGTSGFSGAGATSSTFNKIGRAHV